MGKYFRLRSGLSLVLASCAAAGAGLHAWACTGITVRARDGAIIFARTLEFGVDLQSSVIVIPRGKEFVGTTAGGGPGIRWRSKYGVVGANAFGMPVTLDGLNEQGLHVGLFYFPGYAQYQEVPATETGRSLAPWELGVYLLTTCANVEEATAAAQGVLTGAVVQPDMGIVPPAHYIVSDVKGGCAVLEYVGGKLEVRANPLGVLTNSPTFDWHMTNLGNYVNLRAESAPPVDLAGREVRPLGQGSGMLGMPGDFTPPSRFVRAVAFTHSALPAAGARDGVLQAFHLLNQFDIPPGAARDKEQGRVVADYTLWTAASDLRNKRFYFRTFQNSRIRMIDLQWTDFTGKSIQSLSMKGEEEFEDVTATAK